MKALKLLKKYGYLINQYSMDLVSKDITEAIEELEELIKKDKKKNCEECNWYQEENNDYFESDCGVQFTLFEGMPSENNMIYCHKCGKKLIEHKYVVD